MPRSQRYVPPPEETGEMLPDSTLAVSDLVLDPNNLRLHNERNLAVITDSLRDLGAGRSILIDENNMVLAGNGVTTAAPGAGIERVRIIEALGDELIAIRRRNLTDAQKKRLALIDNRATDLSMFDEELLATLAQTDPELLAGLWDDEELEALLNGNMGDDPAYAVDDETTPQIDHRDALQESWQTARGQCWEIPSIRLPGRSHRLFIGDSTQVADIAALMNGEMASLVLTDPPYNVAYEGKTEEGLTIENDSMDDASFRAFLLAFYANALEHTNPGGGIYVCHADSEGYNFRGALLDAGWLLKQCLIWVKHHFVMGRQDYHWQHEPILYGWKPGAAHTWLSDRKQTTTLNFDRPAASRDHPTMKPVALFAYLMGNTAPRGSIVLDPFLGSGTTLDAAEQSERLCYGMEYDAKYAAVILQRAKDMGLTPSMVTNDTVLVVR